MCAKLPICKDSVKFYCGNLESGGRRRVQEGGCSSRTCAERCGFVGVPLWNEFELLAGLDASLGYFAPFHGLAGGLEASAARRAEKTAGPSLLTGMKTRVFGGTGGTPRRVFNPCIRRASFHPLPTYAIVMPAMSGDGVLGQGADV